MILKEHPLTKAHQGVPNKKEIIKDCLNIFRSMYRLTRNGGKQSSANYLIFVCQLMEIEFKGHPVQTCIEMIKKVTIFIFFSPQCFYVLQCSLALMISMISFYSLFTYGPFFDYIIPNVFLFGLLLLDGDKHKF